MAIIKPEVMTKSKRASNKDSDVVGTDLMPLVSTDGWPTAKRLFEAQKAHGIKSDHMKKSSTHPLQVNSTGKMLLPKDHPVTLEVIVTCHQGDTFHRSVMDTERVPRTLCHAWNGQDSRERVYQSSLSTVPVMYKN